MKNGSNLIWQSELCPKMFRLQIWISKGWEVSIANLAQEHFYK